MYYRSVQFKCSNCGMPAGNQMTAGEVACSSCGAPFTGMCSKCKHVAPYGAFKAAERCPACGSTYFIYASSSDLEEAKAEQERRAQLARHDAEKAARRAARAAARGSAPSAPWWRGWRHS